MCAKVQNYFEPFGCLKALIVSSYLGFVVFYKIVMPIIVKNIFSKDFQDFLST